MKKFVAYDHVQETKDYITGEVASRIHTRVIRLDSSPEKFFKLFVENMGNLYGLNSVSSFKVLFAILNKATNRQNEVCLAFGMRGHLAKNIGIHLNVFKKAFDELINKEILLRSEAKDTFLLNPYIFGQGSFVDVAKLRQKVEFQYDFQKGELKKIISADSATSTGMNILENPEQYNLVDVNMEEKDGSSNLEALVRHKDSNIDEKMIPNESKQLTLDFLDTKNTEKESNTSKDDIVLQAEKTNFDFLVQSFEITNKMLDRIQVLENDGKKEEALIFQKNVEKYLETISNKINKL